MLDFETVRDYDIKLKRNTYIISFSISLILFFIVFIEILSPSKVVGDSMNPTLNNGEIVICVSPNLKHYKRGDIVRIDSVSAGKNIIKRIIGIEGDSIEIRNNIVYVNGNALQEHYTKPNIYYKMQDMKITVPKGYIFVLGDNREVSYDSRSIGCISEAEIKGIVIWCLK